MLKYIVAFIFIYFFINEIKAQVQVDFSEIIKSNIAEGTSSANLCWLLDSDQKRPNPNCSFAEAIKELGSGSLRFPYGHLADNYFWHSPPYSDIKNGLRPRIATKTQAPAKWQWTVAQDGTFKDAMDFDEYMELCQNLNISPLVVVNIISFKYQNGPTFDQLVESAVEWVKYAKEKNYKVDYWQIGNEVDHHPDIITREEYVNAYIIMVEKMKKADPSIIVGPGILSNVSYFNSLINKNAELIDFTSCHQYMWKYIETCSNYNRWKDVDDQFIPNVINMQQAVVNSVKPEMKILITETGMSPSGKGMGSSNNTWKAIWWFEVLMNELSQPNVAYSYFWGTHSPWGGPVDRENDVDVLLRLDNNSRKPIAEVVRFVNQNILPNLVQASSSIKYVKVYAGIDNKNEDCRIFLLNKDDNPQKVRLQMSNVPAKIKDFKLVCLRGESPDDKKLEETNFENIKIEKQEVELWLPPLSINILVNQ